jgi:hypothetical protein
MPEYFLEKLDLNRKPNTSRLFLAEGFSEVGYIEAALSKRGADPNTATILCFAGVSKMVGHTKTIVKLLDPQRLQQLRGVGVMADCENNPNNRVSTIIECAKAFGFQKCATDLIKDGQHTDNERRFALSLSPNSQTPGRIETLILQEKSKDATMECIIGSLDCISQANNGRTVDQKAIVQMFISAAMNSSMAGIRHAFGAALFDPSHNAYKHHAAMVDFILT